MTQSRKAIGSLPTLEVEMEVANLGEGPGGGGGEEHRESMERERNDGIGGILAVVSVTSRNCN